LFAAFDSDASISVEVPRAWTLGNFTNLFANEDGVRLMVNSLIYAGGATIILVVVTTLAGYALSRYDFPGRRALMLGILLTRVIPPTATIAPLYVIATDLGFLNTYHGVVLILAAIEAPLALWTMKGFFDAVPREIEEAAWVDGANRLQAAFRVVLPLAGPGVGAGALIAFIGAWNEFLIPLVLISDQDKIPISIGLFRAWVSYTQVDWGFLAALSIVYVIPAVVFYIFATARTTGFTRGGTCRDLTRPGSATTSGKTRRPAMRQTLLFERVSRWSVSSGFDNLLECGSARTVVSLTLDVPHQRSSP
jgi:ABC-type glycerol-3-phosphate transport system permease component